MLFQIFTGVEKAVRLAAAAVDSVVRRAAASAAAVAMAVTEAWEDSMSPVPAKVREAAWVEVLVAETGVPADKARGLALSDMAAEAAWLERRAAEAAVAAGRAGQASACPVD